MSRRVKALLEEKLLKEKVLMARWREPGDIMFNNSIMFKKEYEKVQDEYSDKIGIVREEETIQKKQVNEARCKRLGIERKKVKPKKRWWRIF